MSIKSKKTGTLGQSRKRDFITILAKLKVQSPLGGWTDGGEQVIYDNYADVRRISEYRTVQYGFESSNILYDIFINPVIIANNLGADFNNDYNNDFSKLLRDKGIESVDIVILYKGKRMKVHFVQDIDDNLGQKLRIVAIGDID